MEAIAQTRRVELQNAEQLSEVNLDWCVDSVQLEPGQFHLVHDQIVFNDLIIERYASNLSKKDEYRLPDSTTLITFLSPNSSSGQWCGYEVSSGVALVNQSGRDHFAVLPGPFEAVSLLVSNQLIDEWEMLPADIVECRSARRKSIIPLIPSESEPFLNWLLSIFTANKQTWHESELETQLMRHQLLSGVSSVIGMSLAEQRLSAKKARYFRRFEMVQQACELIDKRIFERLSTRDVAEALAVTPRTLQRGFEDVFKTSVLDYTRARKLSAVRRELLESPCLKTTVSGVALKYGFAEFGRFSGRYHTMFDELPSETLRRARR